MAEGRTRLLLREMLREEWRLHGRLLGGRRFGPFPALIALLAAGAAGSLSVAGVGSGTVLAGVHALVAVLGLHTGSIGLVGRDALRDLLGDVTLLVFSARTLPLSGERLLAVFVCKDVVFYAAVFLVPIAVGTAPATLGVGEGLVAIPLLAATLTLTFVGGMAATIAALGATSRGVPGLAFLAVLAAAGAAVRTGGIDVVAYTPYGVFLEPTPVRAVAALAVVGGTLLLGALAFDATARRPARTVSPSFRYWWRRVGDPVATRTLLSVHRSAGGFGKPLFSAAILLGATLGLVDLAGRITGVSPSVGVSLGAVLGLSGFTTYNWLTHGDDAGDFLYAPLTVADVLRGKRRAFLACGPAVGLGVYTPAVALYGESLLEAAAGAVVLVGVTCYVFGATVYLAGLSPDEFLFDTLVFGAFGLAVAGPLVPILVVGFAFAPLGPATLAALAAAGVGLAVVGAVCHRRALPRWERRLRRE